MIEQQVLLKCRSTSTHTKIHSVTFQNSSVFWVTIIRANHILVICVMSPWTRELLIEVLEEHSASIFKAEVSQVVKVENSIGWGQGRIDLQEVEWPITTTDGEKGQGPNCSNGKYRPWQWHNSRHNWPWRSYHKMAKGPEKCIYKILFIEPCRKQTQTQNLSFTRAFQSAALTFIDPHRLVLPLTKLYRQPALWNSLFMCNHFKTYLALGESLR